MVAQAGRGLVIVLTGDGKGKTTSALGQAMRAVGHGLRVAFIQFLKRQAVGEHESAKRLAPDLEVHVMGCGFVVAGEGPSKAEHQAAAREALALVRRCLSGGQHEMVVADEILEAVGLGLLTREDVAGLLEARPAGVHLVLTGRGAWDDLVARADLVTEMRSVKHPYDAGTGAQPGVEF